jgi:signal transduction histidine kinase
VHAFSLENERWRNVFLGVLGHDLRGPLNAILLTSRSSFTQQGTGCQRGDARLIRGGERMSQLLDDLLDYSRASLDLGIPAPGPAWISLPRAEKKSSFSEPLGLTNHRTRD